LDVSALMSALGVTIVGAPLLMLVTLGGATLIGRPLGERPASLLVGITTGYGLLASLAVLLLMLFRGDFHVSIDLAHWVPIPHHHFAIKLLFDLLSLPFVILSFSLCGIIASFASKYLHREPGYNRFFCLYAVFVLGMALSSLAGTIETLFAGWELVGLSSALLVGFFHERSLPVRNGLHVWSVYRIADAAFLMAALMLHHLGNAGDFDALLGTGPWPSDPATLLPSQALLVGGLLLVAAAGKSGLVPFSGWVPRAMEGPTPSSAVFYGALSVHLGAYLLLRVSPILDESVWLSGAVVSIGVLTAIYGSITARVQSDIKSALSFASVAQVGLIVAEIGLGFQWLALIHMIGHALLRTLQFLRAPMLLADYRVLENAIGSRLPVAEDFWWRWVPERVRIRLYRFALERGYLDACMIQWFVRPFLWFFSWCDRLERRWTDLLAHGPSRASDQLKPPTPSLEEFA